MTFSTSDFSPLFYVAPALTSFPLSKTAVDVDVEIDRSFFFVPSSKHPAKLESAKLETVLINWRIFPRIVRRWLIRFNVVLSQPGHRWSLRTKDREFKFSQGKWNPITREPVNKVHTTCSTDPFITFNQNFAEPRAIFPTGEPLSFRSDHEKRADSPRNMANEFPENYPPPPFAPCSIWLLSNVLHRVECSKDPLRTVDKDEISFERFSRFSARILDLQICYVRAKADSRDTIFFFWRFFKFIICAYNPPNPLLISTKYYKFSFFHFIEIVSNT